MKALKYTLTYALVSYLIISFCTLEKSNSKVPEHFMLFLLLFFRFLFMLFESREDKTNP